MAIRVIRLGSPMAEDEGLRLGTMRRPRRGVRREDYAMKDLFDVWFPNLVPSEALLKTVAPSPDAASWRSFSRRFTAKMKQTGARRDLELQAALSQRANVAIGCDCDQEARCRRSSLRRLREVAVTGGFRLFLLRHGDAFQPDPGGKPLRRNCLRGMDTFQIESPGVRFDRSVEYPEI